MRLKQFQKKLGFERVVRMDGSSWKAARTVIVIPERTDFFHHKWVAAMLALAAPMNQGRAHVFAIGDEVGAAYTNAIRQILAHPEFGKWEYVLTIESDNIVPWNAHLLLLESINQGFDAVGGLYFTKGDVNQPMCYGRPGTLGFEPLDIRQDIKEGNVIECNGLGMGCTLFRMDLFRETSPPWFVTTESMTQDLFAFRNWKSMGKRFACDARVHVGHMDLKDGTVY